MQSYEPSTYGDRMANVYDAWYEDRMEPSAAVELLAELAQGGRGPRTRYWDGTGGCRWRREA